MTFLLVLLLLWCLLACAAAPLVGRMIARNDGSWVEPAVVLVPAERRPLSKLPPRRLRDPRL